MSWFKIRENVAKSGERQTIIAADGSFIEGPLDVSAPPEKTEAWVTFSEGYVQALHDVKDQLYILESSHGNIDMPYTEDDDGNVYPFEWRAVLEIMIGDE